MGYDPTIYLGSAPYYASGRPAYSAELAATVAAQLGLDGTGRLLDVGCGPGIVTLELAHLFDTAIGLDPDHAMLREGARRARAHEVVDVSWVRAVAEAIPTRTAGVFRAVTFGQSFQWTERERVAEAVYDLLVPGGALVLIVHTVEGRDVPLGPDYPPIPHEDIGALVERHLGARHRAGQGFRNPPPDRYEDALARTRFGRPRVVFAPGRPDLVRDVDSVVAGCYSMSWSAPHLFDDGRDAFESELRALLRARSPTGRFRDWPGDTEILIAEKPRAADPAVRGWRAA